MGSVLGDQVGSEGTGLRSGALAFGMFLEQDQGRSLWAVGGRASAGSGWTQGHRSDLQDLPPGPFVTEHTPPITGQHWGSREPRRVAFRS